MNNVLFNGYQQRMKIEHLDYRILDRKVMRFLSIAPIRTEALKPIIFVGR